MWWATIGRSPMLTGRELKAVLAAMAMEVLAKVYVSLGQGRVFEAERIIAEQIGDGQRATEIVASLVRREWTGGENS